MTEPPRAALDFRAFEVLTFDCYGTIIDWETGLWTALSAVFTTHNVAIDKDRALSIFGALEAEGERGDFRKYHRVLQGVLAGIGRELGFTPSAEEQARFADSIRDWPPFADSSRALARLRSKYKLAIISNVDDDLFAASARKLDVDFDWVITAQQVRSYKPSLNNFRVAFERMGKPRKKILHVAQSIFHDIVPAKTLGLSTVWVNRRHGQSGLGATPPADATPDLEVPDLQTLADLAVGPGR